MFKKIIIPLLLGTMLVTCSKYPTDQFVGTWQATAVIEAGIPLPLELQYINIQFNEDDAYVFNSNLKYQERGTYRTRKQYLLTTDTLHKTPEKAVEIVTFTQDSLTLKMISEKGMEQLMYLKRSNQKNIN